MVTKDNKLAELENLEEELIDLKTVVFSRERLSDYMQSVIFAWVFGTLFFYMDRFINEVENLIIEKWLNWMLLLTAIVSIGTFLYNGKTTKKYNEKLRLKRKIENKKMSITESSWFYEKWRYP